MELRATLLGNHARNVRARNVRARNVRARARNVRARARRIHIRTSTGRPTHTARTSTGRPTHTARPTHNPPYTQPAPRTLPALHTTRPTHTEPRPRPTGIWDEAGARSENKRGSAHSLTPPAVRPETMYFCRYWNSRMTGTAARTAPAAKMPHGAVRSSAAHMYMPTARVN